MAEQGPILDNVVSKVRGAPATLEEAGSEIRVLMRPVPKEDQGIRFRGLGFRGLGLGFRVEGLGGHSADSVEAANTDSLSPKPQTVMSAETLNPKPSETLLKNQKPPNPDTLTPAARIKGLGTLGYARTYKRVPSNTLQGVYNVCKGLGFRIRV